MTIGTGAEIRTRTAWFWRPADFHYLPAIALKRREFWGVKPSYVIKVKPKREIYQ